MIVNFLEINRENLSDWSCDTLHSIQGTLAHNLRERWGDASEEKLLLKLISLEIKRKVKIQSINDDAEKTKRWTIKHWDTVQAQSEPIEPLRFGGMLKKD